MINMKLFLWNNENSSSDFDENYIENFFAHDSSNTHSGGVVRIKMRYLSYSKRQMDLI